jgi:competence protein ComEC
VPGLLPVLAVSLAAGILAADGGWLRPDAALVLGGAALAAGSLLCRSAWPRAALAATACLAAGALSQGLRLESAQRDRPIRPFEATLEASVCEPDSGTGPRVSVLLCEVSAAQPSVLPIPERVRVSESFREDARAWLSALLPGERVRLRLQLGSARGLENPGGRSRERRLARRGVGATGRLVDPSLAVHLSPRDRRPVAAAVAEFRRRIGESLAAAGPGGALLRALAVGDRRSLPAQRRHHFQQLGVGHLLAVSGLHLALVAGLAFAGTRALLVRVTPLAARYDLRRAALASALALASIYGVLAGWGVPVRRSLVFLIAVGTALLLGRRRSARHTLAAAALAVLAVEPQALFDPGAQLSFAASAGLLAVRRGAASGSEAPSPNVLSWLRASLAGVLRTSAVAVAVTGPLLALHGGSVGPYALAANLLMVPLTGLILLPLSLLACASVAVLGSSGSAALLSVCEAAARVTLELLELCAQLLPELAPVAPPALAAVLIAATLAWLSVRLRSDPLRVAAALAAILVLRLAPAAPILPGAPRLVSLDVGLGDATLIQGRSGSLLVDAGRALPGGIDLGRSAVVPALLALGLSGIDLLVATHADLDHRGGLSAVLERIAVGELWLPLGGMADPAFHSLVMAARDAGVRVIERGAGDGAHRFGDLEVTPLWPPPPGPGPVSVASSNDRSLVLRVRVGATRVLLTGDLGGRAERALLASDAVLAADILKLGHHGSADSSGRAFLEAVGAALALVSAPCSGGALPSAAALARARQTGHTLWWTGRDGAVLISLSPPLAVWSWAPDRGCRSR